MKKIISIILCILLAVSTIFVQASTTDVIYETIAEQNPVDNTHPYFKVTAFSADTLLTADNYNKYSQSGTVGSNENVALGFKFNTNNIQDVNNVVYTASFNIHDDIERDVALFLIRKSGTAGVQVLTFVKLNSGVRIYDTKNGNKKYIESPYSDGKAPCTIVYNASTKVLTAQAGDEILTIENIAPDAGTEYTTFRCKISQSTSTGNGGAAEQFTVSDVAMKMEQPAEESEEQVIELTVVGNCISLPLYTPAGGSDKLIIASYDSDSLICCEIKDVGTPTAENIANNKYEFTTSLTGNIRIFLWDDFVTLTPVINSVDCTIN